MKNEKMLLYKKIMVTVVSGGMLLLPNWGYALPQGGQVVGGSGSIGSPGGGRYNGYYRQRRQSGYRLGQL